MQREEGAEVMRMKNLHILVTKGKEEERCQLERQGFKKRNSQRVPYSSSAKEEDLESETEKDSDEDQFDREGSQCSTHNSSTCMRIQPSRAARQPSQVIDISSLAEVDADEGGEKKSLEREATRRNPQQIEEKNDDIMAMNQVEE